VRSPLAGSEPSSWQRTALFLYGVLVVLPAVVLGGLLAHQLTSFQAQHLGAVPAATRDAAARLEKAIADQVDELLASEGARDFFVYDQDYFDPTTVSDGRDGLRYMVRSSPLEYAAVDGVLAWFQGKVGRASTTPPWVKTRRPEPGEQQVVWLERRGQLEAFAAGELVPRLEAEPDLEPAARREERREYPLEQVARNLSEQRDEDTLRDGIAELRRQLRSLENLTVRTSPFALEAVADAKGRPWICAWRRVRIEGLPERVEIPECFPDLRRETLLVQGFVLDREWLLSELPRAAEGRTLGTSMTLALGGEAAASGDPERVVASFDLFEALAIRSPEGFPERERARLTVETSTKELRSSFRTQLAWLAGVVAVMATSLLIGIRLLIGSVRASQSQADRTKNFVAAVTHELRTPVAAVKLYGEMLRDGWATSEEKRREYLDRIVRESDRLDALVDRILRQRRLSETPAAPVPGDLNRVVARLAGELRVAGGGDGADLAFELAPDLSPVLLLEDAVRDVLVNLVENARKYAPVPPGGEPIRVVTRRNRRGKVVLEVSDRGPGIPEEERGRVFDAYYRVGDERTRRTSGTGLGLHLVMLQARSMKARAQALARPGGGATLRVTFRTRAES